MESKRKAILLADGERREEWIYYVKSAFCHANLERLCVFILYCRYNDRKKKLWYSLGRKDLS